VQGALKVSRLQHSAFNAYFLLRLFFASVRIFTSVFLKASERILNIVRLSFKSAFILKLKEVGIITYLGMLYVPINLRYIVGERRENKG